MNIEPWAHLISVAEILELHAENINLYGGDSTPTPREGCIDGSLGAAWSAEAYAGSESAVPGLCFSGYLLYYLILTIPSPIRKS